MLKIKLLPQINIDDTGESTALVRAGLIYGGILLIGFFIWGATAPIQGAVISKGIVKVDFNRKTIQHLEGGIIKQINVREGSLVKKGDALLILEDVFTSSQVNILTDRYKAAKAKESRLMAQKLRADHITFIDELLTDEDKKVKQLLNNEREIFQTKRKSFQDQIKLLNQEIEQNKTQIEGLRKEVEAIKSGIGYIKKKLTASANLQKKGYGEEALVWEQERLLAEKRERLGAQQAEISVAESNITETRLRIITQENKYTQEADDQLKEVQEELLEIQELLRPAQHAFERTVVSSPLDGQVINLKVNTVGGVIAPGADLMEIIPKQNKLIIEAKISTGDIDHVYMDQPTSIQLNPYNSRTTPLLKGIVSYISGDVFEDEVDQGEYYYLCYIEANEDSLALLPENIVLFPGMPTTNFMQTRARTFFDFIMEPLVDNVRKSLREE